jgi:hypothetical protein
MAALTLFCRLATVLGVSTFFSGCQSTAQSTEKLSGPSEFNILVIGQSNAAHYADPSFAHTPKHDVKRVSIHGDLIPAVSPPRDALATGSSGSFEGFLGDLLVSSGKASACNFYNVAVGGTAIGWWLEAAEDTAYAKRSDDLFNYQGNRLFERIVFAVTAAKRHGKPITHVIIHIGETDAVNGTAAIEFVESMASLVDSLRGLGITAPVYIGNTSYVLGMTRTDIAPLMNKYIDTTTGVYRGVDSDRLDASMRYDNIHFNSLGVVSVAYELLDTLGAKHESN